MLKTVGNPSIRYGDQTIVGGNLVVGTAGKGIDFSADSHAAGMTSELLDDYEEGTWTPTLNASGMSGMTYSVQRGRYVKVGKQVTVWCEVTVSGYTSPGSFYLRIEGLPYTNDTAAGTPIAAGSLSYANLTGGTSGRLPRCQLGPSQPSINLVEQDADGKPVSQLMLGTRLTTSSSFAACVTYQAP